MTKTRKIKLKTTKFTPEKRDIMTEMFEEFRIKVVDVSNQPSKSNKMKTVR